jgi:hypothetical protein
LGGTGVWGLSVLQAQNENFVNGAFTKVRQLSRLEESINAVRLAEKSMIIEYERPAEVERAYALWSAKLAEVQQLTEALSKSVEGPAASDISAGLKAYAKAFEPIAAQLKTS